MSPCKYTGYHRRASKYTFMSYDKNIKFKISPSKYIRYHHRTSKYRLRVTMKILN